jgi:hypothetical protein
MILVTGQIQEDQVDFVNEQLAKITGVEFLQVMLVDEKPAKGIDARRQRIVQNHKELEKMIEKTQSVEAFNYVIQIEGDSVLQPDTFTKLLARLDQIPSKNFGYISGVQVGRHGLYCIGAWHFDDEDHFSSVNHRETGLVKVDATGFYCLLAPVNVWLMGNCAWNGERYGPDVVWGRSLRKLGFNIYADMDNEIGHQSTNGVIGLDNLNLCTAHFQRSNDKWSYKVVE